MRKWIPPVLVAASYAFSWFAHSRLPLEVVLRWDALLPWVGPDDAEAVPRAAAAFAIPTLAVAVWLLLRGLASSSGERLGRRLFPDWLLSARTGARAVGRFGPTYDVIVGLVVAFLLLFHTATLGTALDGPEWTLRAFTSLVGVGLMVLGNIMPRTRPNWIAGLRTQRTLSDPDLWRRTHRYFGALLMLTGVAVIAASWLAASYALVIGLGGFLASALVASILGRARSGPRGTEATFVVLVLSMVPLAGPVCLTAETVLPPASRDAAEHPFYATSSGLPSSDQEAGLGGEWSGVWTRGSDTLEVRMRFAPAGDGWTGAFDAERLRVDGIPFTTVEFAAPAARFSIAGDATTTWFEGRVAGDSLVGTLEENGAPGTFAFGRSSPSPASREEEVRFANGEVELAGTLILPDGPGPHPAVVFLHGSGAEGRWASRFLARRLVAAGIAALIYDKRGVGGSTGAWPDAGFEDLTADAAAAVARLRERPDIGRVGLHGHSQGGTIAPMAAVRSAADFVIASAASGLPMDRVEVYSIGNAVGLDSLPPEEAALAEAWVGALVDVAYHGAPRDELDSLTSRAREHDWFFEPPALDASYWSFSRRIADYDPLVWWRRVEVPVLLVWGALDQRVPPEESRAAILAAIEGGAGAPVSDRVFEGADHTFRIRWPGDVWRRTVGGYPDAIVEWLNVVLEAP